MKTIKIIDLLNLVYKKEAPKKIIYKGEEYEFCTDNNDYIAKDNSILFEYLFRYEDNALDLEAKIMEDIPKFEIDEQGYIHTSNGSWKGRKMDIEFANALNYLLGKAKDK